MRDIILAAVLLPMIYSSLRFIHISVMFWIWTALAAPSAFVFGFLSGIPLNKIAVTLSGISLIVDRTKKKMFFDSIFFLHTMLVVQGVVSFIFGITDMTRSADLMDRVVKVWLLAVFIHLANRSREQIHGIVVVFALSAGVHGVLEGFKYILTLGSHKVVPSLTIGDNNYLAVTILMIVPFLLYLAKYSTSKYVQAAFFITAFMSLIGLVATASRGGLVSGVLLGSMMLARSKRKAVGVMTAIAFAGGLLFLAPASWWERMDTLKSAESDGSFMSRVASWKMNALVALDRPFLGGGYSAMEDPRVFRDYLPQFGMLDFIPTELPNTILAAHSIYFQVLGDLGIVGFTIFISMLASCFYSVRRIMQMCKGQKELEWATDLAAAMQQMLVVYMVGGAALSASYFELFYVQISVLSILRRSIMENTSVRGAGRTLAVRGLDSSAVAPTSAWQRPS